MIIGIVCGVAAAFWQDCGYIFSRLYVKKSGTPGQLLLATQLLMGICGIVFLALFWRNGFWGNWSFILPLLGSAFGALFGQLFFFRSEQHISPARISSLMGLRVVLLAIASAIFAGDRYGFWQLSGIVLAALSAAVINYSHGRFNTRGMGWFALTLGFYCLSDLSIRFMLERLHTPSIVHSALLGMSLVNIVLLAATLPWIIRAGFTWQKLKPTMPFAGSWLVKQLLLYSCYGMLGPVFANVIMSLRGPLAIALTLILLHFGFRELDEASGVTVWVRRSVATLMMVAAIVLYSTGGSY